MEFLIMHQLIFLALCTFHICIPISAKTNFLNSICQNGRGNFTADSTFSRSLNTLLSSSVSSIPENNNGFYRFTVGQPTNERVNAIALCRGDVQPYDCVSCIKNASTTLIDLCPNRKEAIIWYDECMFRYSDRPIFHTMETKPSWFRLGGENYTTDSGTLERLLDRVRKSAAYGGSRCKYASDNEMDSSFQTVYALVQCTPDLSASDCDSCLVHIFDRTPGVGGRFLAPSCNARIENEPFNGTTTCGQHQARVPVSKGERGWKIIMNVGIITSVILLASIAGLSAFLCLYKKRNRQGKKAGAEIVSGSSKDSNHQLLQEQNAIAADEDEEQEMHYISLSTLQIATDGFSNANKLGEGGFGSVYKGTLKDGTEIAIKRLSGTSRQGLTELRNEVTLIARLQHKNLVRLLGCCLEKNEEMLVYEYMPNKSLDLFLFDSNVSGQLNWQTRLSIINGIARGMLYLHEDSRLRIIHRDLKASNILVDHDINPKISDFGMARIFGGNQSEAKTNRVVGTYGYMAPEYAMQGLFSVKSDVYSFGVLLLEIISGKKNNSFHLLRNGETLITFAWKLWSRNEGMEIMDRLLTESCLVSEVLKCIHIGLLCVQEDPADRPTMSSVVVMLATKTITLPIPKQPAFSVDQHVPRSTQSTLSDKVCSVNQVTLSSESPR